jgi:hypothetical protein
MNREEAKQILLLYRPGHPTAEDPEFSEALALANRDAELGCWFEEHRRFQETVRAKLRQIEPPPSLREALLPGPKVIRLPSWNLNPFWLAAAAAVVLIFALVRFWPGPHPPDRFADYQAMMVSKATLQYGMDFRTHDDRELRRLIAGKGAPADYALTPGLEKLPLTGGSSLHWRNNPVAMVCFNRGSNNMVFLFVMKASAIKDPPPQQPLVTKVSSLMTASWTRGDTTYVLAGPNEPGFARDYF